MSIFVRIPTLQIPSANILANCFLRADLPFMLKPISYKGCESPTFSTEIIIKDPVSLPQFTPLINICQFEQERAMQAEGNNVTWYTDSVNAVPIERPVPRTSFVPNHAGNYTHWALAQSDKGCMSDTV